MASFSLLSLCCFICAAGWGRAWGEAAATHYYGVDVRSLLPTETCASFEEDVSASFRDGGRLRVADRYGPCSPIAGQKKPISHEQILHQDQARVDRLHRQASASSVVSNLLDQQHPDSLSTSAIPARLGTTGEYVVTVGFGTPRKAQTVEFDTGSDVTWIQCQPCAGSCYQQQDPLFFDPSQSSSYASISCPSAFCSELSDPSCNSATCVYSVVYADNSSTVGFYAEDTLTLTPSDVIPRFRFGCGQNNSGLLGQDAGTIGLGRGKPSLVSQTSQRYGGVFAYCLPATSSKTGYLTFGQYPASSSKLQFTPMLSRASSPTFYYLNLTAISVGGQQLPVSSAVFAAGGSIIDSGTVITYLPPTAYAALRSAFRQGMARYKTAPGISSLDTCYDLTRESNATIPVVALYFGGGARVELTMAGTLYMVSVSKACLAFAANGADSDGVTVGNVQQREFDVVYDVSKKVIGFGKGGC